MSKMKVAFQGEKGAFSEIMALTMFDGVKTIPCKTFEQVFDLVNTDKAENGVIPIENSLTGRISDPTNLLIKSNLKVCGEGKLRIKHCLIANRNKDIKNIKQIYAHPEALAQCKQFLSNLDCELISWYDGAAAANMVKKRKNTALIGSKRIAEIYGLEILQQNIQDSRENITRFFVVSTKVMPPMGNDKTSIIFSVKHICGALFHALKPFVKADVNVTRLESMPIKDKPWEYAFLADFVGHAEEHQIKEALKELKKYCTSLKVLGSYPRCE
ncbi:MAG: prephenate dehydratase [Candidatus Methanofastidiosia archaeon]